MALYTRPQLALLLALLTAAAVGIAVGRWRAAHPDAAERLEAFDLDGTRPARPVREGTLPPPPVRDGALPAPPVGDGAPTPLDRDGTAAPPPSTSHAIKSPAAANDTPPHASADRRSRRRAAPASSPADGSPASRPPLDINRATEAELVQLPGVGRILATRILAAREAAGRFRVIEDLRGVPGFGAGRFESLRGLLVVAP